MRSALRKLRISAHELKIETDRYKKLPNERSQRICERCNLNVIEDEFHFIISCPLYNDNRDRLFLKITHCVQTFSTCLMRQNVYGF